MAKGNYGEMVFFANYGGLFEKFQGLGSTGIVILIK
jgi:hypothetical protein